MKNDDAQLIQRVREGDETAFSALVRKYQRSVHALAWRKIGDFHIAEDITQETFLKAYQRLSTLKEPQSFASWLYVITANQCKAWLRKNRTRTQLLEGTSSAQLEKATYSGYVIAENEQITMETQREVVKKLLAKLQESDRTVITLYYLGGMTYQEISKFLGVSEATIRNRLYRARNRLKKEEPMIREALENFQITPNLTENIMREVSRLKPITPSSSKPLVPWGIIGVSTLVVIFLMLGIGVQYLSRFQKPYSFDATSEMTIDIIETPVVLNIESKPDVRTQLGSTAVPSQNEGAGQQPDDVLFAAAQADGEDVSARKQQWIQAEPMKGSPIMSMLATPEGELYVLGDQLSFYKLPADGKQWQHISDLKSLETSGWTPRPPIAKWKNTLYMIPSNNLFASIDDGKTWDLRYTWQEEEYWAPIELVLTEDAFYVAFTNRILRSEDEGKTWQAITFEAMNIGFPQRPNTVVAIEDTMFVGAENGLYRFSAATDNWKRVESPGPVGEILSIATTGGKIYVAAKFSWDGQVNPDKVFRGQARGWWLFRSTDLGDSWEDITPTNAWPVKGWPPEIQLVAVGETLLAMEEGMVYSTDAGETWMPPLTSSTSPSTISGLPAVVLDEQTFYVYSWDGLHRSTDGGKSWNKVNIPEEKEMTPIDNLIVHQGGDKAENMSSTLYSTFGRGYGAWKEKIAKTTDKGKSWKTIQMEIPMTTPNREEQPSISQIVNSGSVIYAKDGTPANVTNRFYRVSDEDRLVPIQGTPLFDTKSLRNQVLFRDRPIENLSVEYLQENFSGATELFKQLAQGDVQQHEDRIRLRDLLELGFQGPFAVSDDTFYMEYHFKLFRWKLGDTEWHDTGQEETVELTLDIARKDLKLAVSGDTVYVGKRDGRLAVSFDGGNNWIDLTPTLPFPVKVFKEIVFVGSTVYVATEVGVTASDSGKDWHPVTDAAGKNLIMEHLATDGTKVYGVTENTGAYRLESGAWEQIISEIPDNVTSLAVDSDMLYVGTKHNEILHFNLEE